MNTPTDETPEDGKQRRKSIGTPFRGSGGDGGGGSGGLNVGVAKTRRYSIGLASSRKSIEEEGKIVPNYLRASTGSCHDFCKYGKKHEHSKSAIPIKFKRATVVNKEKVTTVVPLERKKTTMVAKLKPLTDPKIQTPVESIERTLKTQVSKRILSTNGKATENEVKMAQRSTSHVKPSSVMVNPDASTGSNGGIKKKDVKTVKKTGMTPKTAVKKVVAMATPTDSQSPKPSFSRAPSLNGIKYKNLKQVSPLKDQNRMQKTEPKKPITEKIQTKTLHGVEPEPDAEPEAKPETTEFEFIRSTIEIIHSSPNPSMELINASVSDSSQSSSNKMVMDEEYESSQLFPDKEILEESSIVPPVSESSQSFSDKEVLEEGSSIAPPVSERSQSSYDEEVLEDESEYTDDEEDEVSEEGSESADNEKVLASENNNEMKTSIGNHKIRNGRLPISEQKDDEAVKLRFRRGKILDLKSENNGPRRLKFRKRRFIEGNEDGQNVARKSFRNKNLDLQTEINGPRRLKFRKAKVMEGNKDQELISRRTFEKKHVEELNESNHGHESVVLKHQGDQGKKDAQGLFNNVIEETASKLVETRKSKVKALVGAFETVISLQDGKPSST